MRLDKEVMGKVSFVGSRLQLAKACSMLDIDLWCVLLVKLLPLRFGTHLVLSRSVYGRVWGLCARPFRPGLPEAGSSLVQHRDEGSSRLLRCADRCRKRQAYRSRCLGGDGRHFEPVAVYTRHTGGGDVGCL